MQCVTHLANTTRIQSLQALCCAGLLDDASQCAICPNPDLAGIGVRVAFYLQSLVNALLIAFSPSDSVPTAWAGTLLTLALVIAGFVSKHGNNLTLHHATLILNFTTLSTISSLAVAPMLPIWKLSPEEFYERHRRRHALLYTDRDDPRYIHDASDLKASWEANHRKQRIKKAQRRQREIISVVLLLQVVLQWAWGIFLFVSPTYSQDYLNNSTQLVLFLAPFETGSINKTTDHPHAGGFLIWAAWILFCLSVTMLLVVNLAVSGSAHSQTSLSSVNTGIGTGYTSHTSNTPIGKQWEKLVRESLILRVTRKEVMKGLKMLTMLSLWALFIAASEWQRLRNCMFDGEQDFGSLGQITALSVSLAPLWSLIVALNKYPSLRRKRQRLGLTQRKSGHAHRDDDDDERAGHDDSDETGRLLRNSLTISPPTGHLLLPSDETLRNSSESFEMSVLRPFQDVIGLDHQPGTSTSFPIPHSASTPSRHLSPSMPNPAPELYSHQRSALRTTATPLAAPLSSSESSSISDGTNTGGIGSIGSGERGLSPGTTSTGLNRRPVLRPHGPRPSISLSPTEFSVWGGQSRDLHSLGSR